MGSLTNYGRNAVISHLCGSAFSPPSAVYMALFTADPGVAGAMTNEVADAYNYQRTAITFSAASSRKVTQNAQLTFPTANGAWGTITHWGLCDSQTRGGGNMLAFGAFTASFSPVSGNAPYITTGQCYVQISAGAGGVGYTDYFVHKMLDLIFRNVAYSQPATYVALLDQTGAESDTTLTTAGKEVSGTDYARVLVNKYGGSSPAWEQPVNGVTQNANAVSFPTVGSGGWANIVGAALVDGGTLNAGNVLAFDNTNVVDQSAAESDPVLFSVGAFDIALS